MSKKRGFENPLNNMDPISQIQEFKDNVSELNQNFKNIVKIVTPMVRKGLIMPCDISKKISKTLCSITNTANTKFDLFDKSFSNLNLSNIVDITGGNSNVTVEKEIEREVEKKVELPKITKPKNTKKYKKGRYFGRNRSQSGGGNIYNYIVNPVTGRKVLISGKKGRQILKKYIFNF